MTYKTMRKAFHDPKCDSGALFASRFESDDAVHLDFDISGSPAFFVMCSDVYRLMVRAAELDKEVLKLRHELPGKAIDDYMNSCLIDEVVLTNEIEGVNSSRREIGEVLENLKKNDRRGRFYGIVSKYMMLQSRENIPMHTCADIRSIYDDLVLDEVVASDGADAPDGEFFRKGPVNVCDASGKSIHAGLEPESAINNAMQKAVSVLMDDGLNTMVRVSIFHFLFGYIHPFYDGNGRTNRFMSSYVIAHTYEPLIGFRLSYSIKERIEKYYKGFTVCEHPMNKGDLTPFVLMFSEVIVEAMESMKESLEERKDELRSCEERIVALPEIEKDEELVAFASVLAQAALFASYGASTKELARTFNLSNPTVYKRLDVFKKMGMLVRRQIGHSVYYSLDVQKLRQINTSDMLKRQSASSGPGA